jgi:hypothetical protein
MARLVPLVAAAVAASSLVLAGCGGGPEPACDDAGFRNQSEELYVAITTAQNAQTPGAGPAVVADLERGARVLGDYLAAHPPCAEDLRGLAADEDAALALIDEGLAALRAGEGPNAALADAVERLGRVEVALRRP